MLNIKGAFVVVGEKGVTAHLVGMTTFNLFMDRVRVSGEAKANKATFGNEALYVFPATLDCMTFIALNYNGVHEAQVKAVCARIALGQPLGDDTNPSDPKGGLGVVTDDSKPIKPKGGAGAKAKAPVTVDTITSMLKSA